MENGLMEIFILVLIFLEFLHLKNSLSIFKIINLI
jgi:hypothetical protein